VATDVYARRFIRGFDDSTGVWHPTILSWRLAEYRAIMADLLDPSRCRDCGLDVTPCDWLGRPVLGTWFWYMARDRVWRKAGMSKVVDRSYLCVPCLEQRLGRQLVPGDFKLNVPVNDFSALHHPLLLARQGYGEWP